MAAAAPLRAAAGLAAVDLAQQVAPAAQEVLVGKLPAVGVDLAEALRAALRGWAGRRTQWAMDAWQNAGAASAAVPAGQCCVAPQTCKKEGRRNATACTGQLHLAGQRLPLTVQRQLFPMLPLMQTAHLRANHTNSAQAAIGALQQAATTNTFGTLRPPAPT